MRHANGYICVIAKIAPANERLLEGKRASPAHFVRRHH